MAITTKFSFVGSIMIPKAESKRPFYSEFKGGKDKSQQMASMNFGVKESDNNMAFVEAFSSIHDTILTQSADNENIEIKWADRFDADVLKSVAGFKKYTVDLGEKFGGRKEYISQYDAIEHLKQWLPQYKECKESNNGNGKGKVLVTGQFVKEWYKNQYYDKFKFQSIYAMADDAKNRLALTADIFYNKDSIDKTDFEKDKKIYLNGYISQYINKDEGNKYIPQQFIFSASKYDLTGNEKHKQLYDYKMRYIDIKNKTMAHMLWDIVLIRGAEEVEFNETMLTAAQREQVELGIKTVDDFKPRGNIFGNNIIEYRLFEPKLINDFKDGIVDTDEKLTEFEEKINIAPKDENIGDVVNNTDSESTVSETKDNQKVGEDDLF